MGIRTSFIRVTFSCLLIWSGMVYPNLLLAQQYGLKFNGHEVTLDKRTGLDLTPHGLLASRGEFEISFTHKVHRLKPNSNEGLFGYVFRIIDGDGNNIDLLSTPTPKVGLNLVIGKTNIVVPVQYPNKAGKNNWVEIRVRFLMEADRLELVISDTTYVREKVGFDKKESFKIVFGAHSYGQFMNSDVPSMTIKDIRIFERGALKHYWPLDESTGNIATDSVDGKRAEVINPGWVITNYQHWSPVFKGEVEGTVLVAADTGENRIFMVGTHELFIYSTQNSSVKRVAYGNTPPPFLSSSYSAVFNPINNKIYCYLPDSGNYYVLDVETGTWVEKDTPATDEIKFGHHNQFFNASDSSIYVFGGYGRHRYNNHIIKLNLNNSTWGALPTDSAIFEPRYLAGLGALNDTIYILGGYGSESGNQLVNPHSYFNMFGYAIKHNSLFKKFEISPRLIDDMVVGKSMWINAENRNYYALVFSKIKFNNYLQLIKGNLESPQVERVGSKIPFKFFDVRSTANLYYFPTQDKLYTYTSYHDDSTTQVTIYSINNPPNTVIGKPEEKTIRSAFSKVLIGIILVLIAGAVFFIAWRKRDKKRVSSLPSETKQQKDTVEKETADTEEIVKDPHYQLVFFGGLQVFDKWYEEITCKFSPLLKELFLLILLHSLKNDKGISSETIIEVLWYDKADKSARNNLSVNIRKLRGILEEIGSLEISKKTGYWKIILKDPEIKSDYIDFMGITRSKDNLTRQEVIRLLEITQRGGFLVNMQYEWLDDFKSSVASIAVDTLIGFAKSCNLKADADFIAQLADSTFNFDIINEDAMILKCKAQNCMGKHSLAKATFEKFYKEYIAMYGEAYPIPFLNVLDIDN